jgi:hypothetical protein
VKTCPTEEHEIVNEKPTLWPIRPPPGGGAWPSEEYEIDNEEEFTLMDLAAPWRRVWGRGLTQLKSRKMPMMYRQIGQNEFHFD